jgi:sphingosine kinase
MAWLDYCSLVLIVVSIKALMLIVSFI